MTQVICLRSAAQMTMPDLVCAGETRQYHVSPGAGAGSTFTWWIDGEKMAGFNASRFNYAWNSPGTYLLEVQERSADGCMGQKLSGLVRVNPIPEIRISVSDTLIHAGENVVFSVRNPTQLVWGKWVYDLIVEPDAGVTGNTVNGTYTSPAILDEVLYAYDMKIHKVVYRFVPAIVNDAGDMECEGEELKFTVWIYPGSVDKDICVEIPDAFSPNGDGINDGWNIKNIEFYPESEVTVYNRWGQLVWESGKGYPVPWNGRSRSEELPIDSYHYVIDLHNGYKPIVGVVTIVK